MELEETDKKRKKNKDLCDLKQLMFGFGDCKSPLDETVELLDEYMQEFVLNLSEKALKRSKRRDTNNNEIKVEDLLYFLQSDNKKSMRVAKIIQTYQICKETLNKKNKYQNFEWSYITPIFILQLNYYNALLFKTLFLHTLKLKLFYKKYNDKANIKSKIIYTTFVKKFLVTWIIIKWSQFTKENRGNGQEIEYFIIVKFRLVKADVGKWAFIR